MKKYTVYLHRSPECVRGWLAYIKKDQLSHRATITVIIDAENGQKAKNKAITAANNGFKGLDIIKKNFDDAIWGLNNFPELKAIIEDPTL